MHADTSNWTLIKRKKLQHMTEFHKEYQWIFGEKASIHTIMKRRILHMNPPIPDSVCKEEMQSANVDANEVVIEYITDAQGNKIKKLKPLIIKSEPDREYLNTYTVMITFLMSLKKIFYKREKLQLIPIVKLFLLILLVMMTL